MTKAAWSLCLLTFAPLLAGCSLFPNFGHTKSEKSDKETASGAPGKYSLRVSQFIFMSDVEIQRDQPIFKDLSNLREQVYRELKLPPSSTEVFVYLFENEAAYLKFIHTQYPKLPDRRAYFIAQPRRLGGADELSVYTYIGDSTRKDLRHELTHAMLHCVLKKVPIWLDEGLAEYFELPLNQDGVNTKHLENLRNVRFDLDRLEQLKEVHQMSPAEYRESWAWVHLMLRSTPQAKQALLGYLQELRVNPEPDTLRPRLAPAFLSLENALQSHLAELERKLPRNATAKQ